MGTNRGLNQTSPQREVSIMSSFGVGKPALFMAWKDYMACRQMGMTPRESLEQAKEHSSNITFDVLACYGLENISDMMEEVLHGD